MMGKYHNVLYIGLKVAWDWGVRNSSIICQLLGENKCISWHAEMHFSLPSDSMLYLRLSSSLPAHCSTPEEIFHCEGTFERLFLGAIFGTNAPHFIAGWKADFKDQVNEGMNEGGGTMRFAGQLFAQKISMSLFQDENCRALVFYLEHATRCRLTFPVVLNARSPVRHLRFVPFTFVFRLFAYTHSNSSFIDVPIESCGKASPLRVTLQASAPDILLILLR